MPGLAGKIPGWWTVLVGILSSKRSPFSIFQAVLFMRIWPRSGEDVGGETDVNDLDLSGCLDSEQRNGFGTQVKKA